MRPYQIANKVLQAIECAPTWAGIVTMLCVGLVLGTMLEAEQVFSAEVFMLAITCLLFVLSFGTISLLRRSRNRHEVVFMSIGLIALVASLGGRFVSGDGGLWSVAYVVSSAMLFWYIVMVLYLHTRVCRDHWERKE